MQPAQVHTRSSRKRENMCSQITSRGVFCSNHGRHMYNGVLLCDHHLDIVKSNEDCPICYNTMRDSPTRILLPCGHYFHTTCLSTWAIPTCPTCRAAIPPNTAVDINMVPRIRPMMARLFEMVPQQDIATAFDVLNRVVDLCADGLATHLISALDPSRDPPPSQFVPQDATAMPIPAILVEMYPPHPPAAPQTPTHPPPLRSQRPQASHILIPSPSAGLPSTFTRPYGRMDESPPSPSSILLPFGNEVYRLPIPLQVPVPDV